LPFNYDLTEFSKFNYKKYNIHNYNLIIIYWIWYFLYK
jgi:hypothetical protein